MATSDRWEDRHVAASAIRFAVATRFEGWCLKWLHDRLKFFLAGVEKARVDCGLLLGPDPDTVSDFTERVNVTVWQHEDELRLLTLDCKTIQPIPLPTYKGGIFRHQIHRTAGERPCAAFIVHSPAAPDDVALIPTVYLARTEWKDEDRVFHGREIPLTGAPLEPFPLEWSPFVMPLVDLPTNLKLLRNFAMDHVQGWRNTHTGIEFEGLRPLKPRPLNLLLPADESKTDYYDMRLLWQACHDNNTRFRIERPIVQPSVADFVLRDTQTGLATMVELKRSLYQRLSEKLTIPFDRFTGRLCQPWNIYDHLLILHSTRKEGYIFSRNETPDQWHTLYTILKRVATKAEMTFNDAVTQLDLHLKGTAPSAENKLQQLLPHLDDTSPFKLEIDISPPDRLDNHRLRWTDQKSYARSLNEAILRYQKKDQFCGSKPLQQGPPSAAAATSATDVVTAGQTAGGQHVVAGQPLFRGMGRRWSPKQFAAVREEAIEKQLKSWTSQGRLIYLGLHPCGSYAYVPNITSGLSFHDLNLDTPLFYVNMATIVLEDLLIPNDGKRTRSLLHATHGAHDSIYLIAPRVRGMEDPRLKMYVLPSWLIDTPQREKLHQKLIDNPNTLSMKRIFLLNGDCFENYACAMADVAAKMDALARTHADRLLSNKREAVDKFFRLYIDKSFHRLCTPTAEESEIEDEGDWSGE